MSVELTRTIREVDVTLTRDVNQVILQPILKDVVSGSGVVVEVVAGTNVTVDNTDPTKPIVSASGGGSVAEVATYSATSTAITTLDCDTFDSRYQILTANTDIQWTNTPASGESFVKNLEVVSTTTESLAFSTATKVIGSYDVGEINLITVNFANYPTVGLRITVLITQ